METFGKMTDMSGDRTSGLPDDVRQLLGAAPLMEKRLLELNVGWADLSAAQARLADALRVFVITWDPLETSRPRPDGFAIVNVEPTELAVYLPSWSLLELAKAWDNGIAAVLGAMAGSAVVTGASHEESVITG